MEYFIGRFKGETKYQLFCMDDRDSYYYLTKMGCDELYRKEDIENCFPAKIVDSCGCDLSYLIETIWN